MKMKQSVPKRRHIKFRRQGITQKKAYDFLLNIYRTEKCFGKDVEDYVEIKCQLDATDDIYCRFYCMLNIFRAILCPSSGAREYYTDGRCLWYLVLLL